MISNILSRVVEILSSLLVISVLVFLLIQIVPGDPIVQMLGENTTPTIVEEMRSYYGLDRPLHVQYLSWLQRVLHGDLGRSIRTRLEVSKEIMERFPSTFLLAISATALSTVLAVPIGILSAYRMNSLVDYAVRATSMVGVAMPGFVVAVLLILILSVKLDLLPISGAPAML
ncbi:MAG TPA: ABC transporter permease, partial [bacterium]|nr:ABC transporter permease [bacterium]